MEETRPTIIRQAAGGDAAAIALVLAQAFAPYQMQYTSAAYAATTPPPEVIAGRFVEGPIWVADQAEVVVGTVSAVPQGMALYVRSLAVLPTARGQELGRKFLAVVEAYARSHDLLRLTLSTTPFLTPAIRLYEQVGFQISSDGPRELLGTPLITMTKVLATVADDADTGAGSDSPPPKEN